MSSGLRRRRALQALKEIDAFPKVPESYQQTTVSGGGISLVVFVALVILIVSEIHYFNDSELKFNYSVDEDYAAKLKLDIDMTVAMPCSYIGADILDMTGADAHSHDDRRLVEEDVYFTLSPRQRSYFEMLQSINSYIKEEYHAIHDVLWRTGYGSLSRNKPQREDKPTGRMDGCRLHGNIAVNKVAGNFHITAGNYSFNPRMFKLWTQIPHRVSLGLLPDMCYGCKFRGRTHAFGFVWHIPERIQVQSFGSNSHAHLALGIKDSEYNFSHRIDRFSFGDYVSGIVNPLDGEEKTIYENYHMFQYFIQVVPTEVNTQFNRVNSYQYAVTERNRTISHASGSHGVPGIFFKYDLSALKVRVSEERRGYFRLFIKLCGIVGGIFQVSGILHGIIGLFFDALCCRWTVCKRTTNQTSNQTANLTTNLSDSPSVTQPLLSPQSSQSFSSEPTQNLMTSSVSAGPNSAGEGSMGPGWPQSANIQVPS